ncbi:MAG: mechanosensitive ion channel family protein, partial [Maritimibacter harenae]
VVTIAAGLMTFESVRQYGVSLLAAGGAAGIIVGLAAQPVLSNLFAGLQLALTQPIRIDDAVIVEGEWGTIEEITATYVVIKVWDWRRLVVPLRYFIEQPFQNWTRESASIIGSVFWYLDYTVPVQEVRAKLEEIIRDSPHWDGKVVNLQVTDTDKDTIALRGLMSARTSPQAWDLRCEIREKIVAWLQETYPEALPRLRGELAMTTGDGQ